MGIGFGALEGLVKSVRKYRYIPNRWLGSRWCIYKDHAESSLTDFLTPRPPFYDGLCFYKKTGNQYE